MEQRTATCVSGEPLPKADSGRGRCVRRLELTVLQKPERSFVPAGYCKTMTLTERQCGGEVRDMAMRMLGKVTFAGASGMQSVD